MISQTPEEFAADMERMATQIESAVPEALRLCEPLVVENIVANFARAESPDGIAWPERKEVGDGHPLLVETNTVGSGSLFAAATGQGGGHVSRIDGNALLVGVDKDGGIGGIPGAGVHNYGFAANAWGSIPQREFLGIGETTTDACGEVLADRLLKELG